MKKTILTLTLGATLALANNIPNDDLLNLATAGKTNGTTLEMGKEDMAKADGGYYSRYRGVGSYYYNLNTRSSYYSPYRYSSYKSRIYARSFGSYYWNRYHR